MTSCTPATRGGFVNDVTDLEWQIQNGSAHGAVRGSYHARPQMNRNRAVSVRFILFLSIRHVMLLYLGLPYSCLLVPANSPTVWQAPLSSLE